MNRLTAEQEHTAAALAACAGLELHAARALVLTAPPALGLGTIGNPTGDAYRIAAHLHASPEHRIAAQHGPAVQLQALAHDPAVPTARYPDLLAAWESLWREARP